MSFLPNKTENQSITDSTAAEGYHLFYNNCTSETFCQGAKDAWEGRIQDWV